MTEERKQWRLTMGPEAPFSPAEPDSPWWGEKIRSLEQVIGKHGRNCTPIWFAWYALELEVLKYFCLSKTSNSVEELCSKYKSGFYMINGKSKVSISIKINV